MLGLIQVLGCTLGLVLVNKLGCRGLLLNSLAFCSLTMTALAISIHMKWQWMSLIMLILFTFSFMSGLSNVPWVLVGELPTERKALVVGISTGFCYFFISSCAFAFPFMNKWELWYGPLGTFLFYAALSALGFVFVFFVIKTPKKESQSPRYVG